MAILPWLSLYLCHFRMTAVCVCVNIFSSFPYVLLRIHHSPECLLSSSEYWDSPKLTSLYFFFPSFYIIPHTFWFSHAFLSVNTGLFLKLKSRKQKDVLILWCQCDQRPSSILTWVISSISGPGIS